MNKHTKITARECVKEYLIKVNPMTPNHVTLANRFAKYFRGTPLSTIRDCDITAFENSIIDSYLTYTTKYTYRAGLKRLLSYAIDCGYINHLIEYVGQHFTNNRITKNAITKKEAHAKKAGLPQKYGLKAAWIDEAIHNKLRELSFYTGMPMIRILKLFIHVGMNNITNHKDIPALYKELETLDKPDNVPTIESLQLQITKLEGHIENLKSTIDEM